jgi:hypothetical protein
MRIANMPLPENEGRSVMREVQKEMMLDTRVFPNRYKTALMVLREAHDRARECGLVIWEFAVEMGQLQTAGLSLSDLRWLIYQGAIEHAEEVHSQSSSRRFRQLPNLRFPERTCFVLTETGTRWTIVMANGSDGVCDEVENALPHWDAERRELYWGKEIIKRFRLPAKNQERLLAVFEEENWPSRIDDPLPIEDEIEPQARLRDAIRRLNKGHELRAIRFHGDGNGMGVCWRTTSTSRPQRAH